MSNENSKNKNQVLLISMPWGPIMEPSLGLSILKSVLIKNGIKCKVIEAPMRLLKWLKYPTYHEYARFWALNDFLFTHAFEPILSSEQIKLVQRICQDDLSLSVNYFKKMNPADKATDKIVCLRQEIIPRFLDELMDEIDFGQYSMVGFTCQFDQTWASLALAKRIKQKYPKLPLIFGGYAVADPVGIALQKIFPEIDVIAYGDGEPIIIPLVEAICGYRSFEDVPSISFRDSKEVIRKNASYGYYDLGKSLAPNFDDWFYQREEMKKKYQIEIPCNGLPVESSRGCWWGQKKHCVFCGIDEEALKYRRKPGKLVVSQLDTLNEKYKTTTFRFNDYIMPNQSFNDFWPLMAKRGAPYDLHYEIKSNLKIDQIKMMAKGGIYLVQPGIESFSTPVLKRMNKGVTAIQNIFLIHSLMRNGIGVFYNIIFGFPGDTVEDYQKMLQIMPCLYHLFSPGTVLWPMVVRYSPLAESPEKFGYHGSMEAHWRYSVMFSDAYVHKNNLNMDSYAYYFESPYKSSDSTLRLLFSTVQHQVMNWREVFNRNIARLSYNVDSDGVIFRDTRFSQKGEIYNFGHEHGQVYDILSTDMLNLKQILAKSFELQITEKRTRAVLQDFCEARVVISENEKYVALALPEEFYAEKRDWWHYQQRPEENKMDVSCAV